MIAELLVPPFSPIETVTEVLHGVTVCDPYRWLEEQTSDRTRQWLANQTAYAQSYFQSLPFRAALRSSVQQLLDRETYDTFLGGSNHYFFRKRMPGQEQHCIYRRRGADGTDELLVDPSVLGGGNFVAVKPIRASSDDSLLLYEVKNGGERTGRFEIRDIKRGRVLPDALPRGYLRSFEFSDDNRSFLYVHEEWNDKNTKSAIKRHTLGTPFGEDTVVFSAAEPSIRLAFMSEGRRVLIFVFRMTGKCSSEHYLLSEGGRPEHLYTAGDEMFSLRLVDGRLFALTNLNAPHLRIVEIPLDSPGQTYWRELVSEGEKPIAEWQITREYIAINYRDHVNNEVRTHNLAGQELDRFLGSDQETLRLVAGLAAPGSYLIARESFTEPGSVWEYGYAGGRLKPFSQRFASTFSFESSRAWYRSLDSTEVPMYVVGRKETLQQKHAPTVMTSYGGFSAAMTPQFSVLVSILMEHGCLFALPNIRGGSEFGSGWHEAAKRRQRQTAYDDFIAAAQWLRAYGYADNNRMAMFGGSNSGLLVGAVMTQRPDLFRAVLCMVPLLDMIRYHLFDRAIDWKDEYGTAEDPEDFEALWGYSPYHRIQDGTAYPAVMLVSGDADQNCNPMHARKAAARLQKASSSGLPIILDYSTLRGHSPVLPLTVRVESLVNRLAFLFDQLQLRPEGRS